MKKLFTVVVALMLAMCLMVPAFAEETASASGNASGNASVMTVEAVETTIKLAETITAVPTNADAVMTSTAFRKLDETTKNTLVFDTLGSKGTEGAPQIVKTEIYEVTPTLVAPNAEGVYEFTGTMAKFEIVSPVTTAPVPAGYTRTIKITAIHEDGSIDTFMSTQALSASGCVCYDPTTGKVTVYSSRFSTFIVNVIDTLAPVPTPAPTPAPAPAPAPAYTVVNTSAK